MWNNLIIHRVWTAQMTSFNREYSNVFCRGFPSHDTIWLHDKCLRSVDVLFFIEFIHFYLVFPYFGLKTENKSFRGFPWNSEGGFCFTRYKTIVWWSSLVLVNFLFITVCSQTHGTLFIFYVIMQWFLCSFCHCVWNRIIISAWKVHCNFWCHYLNAFRLT